MAKTLELFYPRKEKSPLIHSRAIISENAKIGKDVIVHSGAVIGKNVLIGDRTEIGNNTVIGDSSELGSDCNYIYIN